MSTFLTDDTRKFLTGGVSITLASRNAQLIPSIARGKGCALAAPKLRVFVSAAQAPDLVEDVRASRMISVSFSMPSTHQSMQLKGSDAKVLPIAPAERELISGYVPAFAAALAPLGFSEEFVRTFFASSDEVAIEFTPTEGFEQTPGPSAGTRLA
jgi:hypothetical protein